MVETVVPKYVPVAEAQRSRVVHFPGLLGAEDLRQVLDYHGQALAAGDPLELNPQNREHHLKRCTFLHGATAPNGGLVKHAPSVLAKLLRAAVLAKDMGGWGEGAGEHGPLWDVDVRRLSLRVVELWEYEPGGGLPDTQHFDAGSIITIVCQVCEGADFTGGRFQTLEQSGQHAEHGLERGDVLCFLSHKYHSITPVESGRRVSLVVELWQGGLPMWCR